jgi:hypothetical protein
VAFFRSACPLVHGECQVSMRDVLCISTMLIVTLKDTNMDGVLNYNATTFAQVCNSNLISNTSSQEKEIVIYKIY